jgi:putative Ca2+/H+ antiporter (TMEM165/GDT1 family)
MTVATSFFVAELGDKTMLTTVAVASRYTSFVGVWLGSTVGMVAADGLAIMVGIILGKRLPEKAIRYGAAAIFLASGIYAIGQGVMAFRSGLGR